MDLSHDWIMDVPNGFSDPDKTFTLFWANSMGTFTTSFSRSILPLGGFGGPEKDRKFVWWLLSSTQVLAHLWTGPAQFLASRRTALFGT